MPRRRISDTKSSNSGPKLVEQSSMAVPFLSKLPIELEGVPTENMNAIHKKKRRLSPVVVISPLKTTRIEKPQSNRISQSSNVPSSKKTYTETNSLIRKKQKKALPVETKKSRCARESQVASVSSLRPSIKPRRRISQTSNSKSNPKLVEPFLKITPLLPKLRIENTENMIAGPIKTWQWSPVVVISPLKPSNKRKRKITRDEEPKSNRIETRK